MKQAIDLEHKKEIKKRNALFRIPFLFSIINNYQLHPVVAPQV